MWKTRQAHSNSAKLERNSSTFRTKSPKRVNEQCNALVLTKYKLDAESMDIETKQHCCQLQSRRSKVDLIKEKCYTLSI